MVVYTCIECNFSVSIKSHYERHLKTKKHQQKVAVQSQYCCTHCGKHFTTRQGKHQHMRNNVCTQSAMCNNTTKKIKDKSSISTKKMYDALIQIDEKLENLSKKPVKNTINIANIYTMKPLNLLNTFYYNHPPLLELIKYIEIQDISREQANQLKLATSVDNTDFVADELDKIIKSMNKQFIHDTHITGITCDSVVFVNDGSVRKYIAKGQDSWTYMNDENLLDNMISYIFDRMYIKYKIPIHYLKKERMDIIKKIKKLNGWESEKDALIKKLNDTSIDTLNHKIAAFQLQT